MLGPRPYCITNLAQGGSVAQVADHALGVRGPLATSFRSHEGRDIDSASRRILQRMRSQIDHGQLRPVDRSDSIANGLLVAARKPIVGKRMQIHSVAVAAAAMQMRALALRTGAFAFM
jgi:hypothetical protein